MSFASGCQFISGVIPDERTCCPIWKIWLATAPLGLEPQLRRIKDYETRPLLQQALHQYVGKGKKSAA